MDSTETTMGGFVIITTVLILFFMVLATLTEEIGETQDEKCQIGAYGPINCFNETYRKQTNKIYDGFELTSLIPLIVAWGILISLLTGVYNQIK